MARPAHLGYGFTPPQARTYQRQTPRLTPDEGPPSLRAAEPEPGTYLERPLPAGHRGRNRNLGTLAPWVGWVGREGQRDRVLRLERGLWSLWASRYASLTPREWCVRHERSGPDILDSFTKKNTCNGPKSVTCRSLCTRPSAGRPHTHSLSMRHRAQTIDRGLGAGRAARVCIVAWVHFTLPPCDRAFSGGAA